MENTLSNTLKNANMAVPTIQQRKSKSGKKVSFSTGMNDYYEPKVYEEEPEVKVPFANGNSVSDSDFLNQ